MGASPAPLSSITVGDIRVTHLPDGEGHFATALIPASTEEAWLAHRRWLDDDGRIVGTFGGFLVETGDRKVVVDTGFGDQYVEYPDFATLEGGRDRPGEATLDALRDRIEHPAGDATIPPGVDLLSTPGHTPGHHSVVLSSGTARAVILGDVLSCPAQIPNEEWSVVFDVDPDLAGRTRQRVLAAEGRRYWRAEPAGGGR